MFLARRLWLAIKTGILDEYNEFQVKMDASLQNQRPMIPADRPSSTGCIWNQYDAEHSMPRNTASMEKRRMKHL